MSNKLITGVNILDVIANTSSKITQFVNKSTQSKTKVELEQIQYGIHILLNNLIKLTVVFLAAYFLGIFKYVIIAFLSFSFLRSSASGIHARTSITCLISTAAIFLGAAYLGISIQLGYRDISVVFTTCTLLLYLYAPADTEEKPLVSKRLRRRLKIFALGSNVLLFAVCLILKGSIFASVITFSVLIECLSITPFIYFIFKRRYRNYENVCIKNSGSH